MQALIDCALRFKENDLYQIIIDFQSVFCEYTGYLTKLCHLTPNGMIKYVPYKYEGSIIEEKKETDKAEELRKKAQMSLDEIAEYY